MKRLLYLLLVIFFSCETNASFTNVEDVIISAEKKILEGNKVNFTGTEKKILETFIVDQQVSMKEKKVDFYKFKGLILLCRGLNVLGQTESGFKQLLKLRGSVAAIDDLIEEQIKGDANIPSSRKRSHFAEHNLSADYNFAKSFLMFTKAKSLKSNGDITKAEKLLSLAIKAIAEAVNESSGSKRVKIYEKIQKSFLGKSNEWFENNKE